MTPTKTYTMEELHRMDPAKVISYDGRRPMQVNEVIQHLNRDDWPAETSTQTSETASHQEHQA
jgi:hypothetical protein